MTVDQQDPDQQQQEKLKLVDGSTSSYPEKQASKQPRASLTGDKSTAKHAATPALAWGILACAAMNVIFLGGKRRAFGMFVAQLHVEFNATVSLAELNWIGDSYAALGYIGTFFSSAAIVACSRRYRIFQSIGCILLLASCCTSAIVPNPHWLFLTHTALHGAASSLLLSVAGLAVDEHFPAGHKYRILATTLVSGGSIASIAFVQVYALIIDTYGWRSAFVILGVVYFLVTGVGVWIYSRSRSSSSDSSDSSDCSSSCLQGIKRHQAPLLVLWLCDRALTSIVTYGLLLNLADYSRRTEASLTKASQLTVLLAAGEASAYVVAASGAALRGDFLRNRLKFVLLFCTAALCVQLTVWELLADQHLIACILSFLCGAALGPSIAFLFPAGEELTELPGRLAYPFSLAGMGIGMALSPCLTAVIAERRQYRGFFLIQAALMLLKLLCLLAILLVQLLGNWQPCLKAGKSWQRHREGRQRRGSNTHMLLDDCE